MKLSVAHFAEFHSAVHANPPFDWQMRLLEQVMTERAWPRVLDLPTGSGKTTCIDIALFALAIDAGNSAGRWCPRRIAMVVDRRIVVDQVAERGRKLLSKLVEGNSHAVVSEVADRLRSLSKGGEDPVGVFTLRGGIPKDDGWARTPDQPLILASTVDQIGSRLLIQGYGVTRGMKPVHAGLIANDTLLLLDEVHLSQPFAETLEQLAELRRRFAGAGRLEPRFHHAFLSATPGSTEASTFRLTEKEKDPDSPLGPRLHASKPARLRDVPDRTTLEAECAREALRLIEEHAAVCVIVNRVASAQIVSRQIRGKVGDRADVVLLTGRMRSIDRDEVLRTLRPRVMANRDRSATNRKVIVVGTQCLEAGADFDFDALVTEAASLDALRQRFGRLDRLGIYEKAEALVVRDRSAKTDPVYEDALVKTMAWLKEQLDKKSKAVDFGVLRLPSPPTEQLDAMLAPKAHAPVLMPAYLDLWMQTSPAPVNVPDISLWLHGPRSGPPDVQVVWRADLKDADLDEVSGSTAAAELAAAVGAVRPSGLEAMGVPIGAARAWLSGDGIAEIADVEGAGQGAERAGQDAGVRGGRFALRWLGEESEVIRADQLRPGDTIVVPATRGGIRDGCFDPTCTDHPVRDLAEQAALFGRGQPTLRLRADVLANFGLSLPTDDLGDARAALRSAADQADPKSWRSLWLDRLANSRTHIVVDGPDPWLVLRGRAVKRELLRSLLDPDDTIESGAELTTDDDDSFHAGRPVTLKEHSSDVERFARRYASAIGLPTHLVEDVALAAWLHDIGKADPRFQIMLREGSEIAYFKNDTPWAKSSMPSGAKAAHRLARRRSKYPKGARHEVQSVAMIEKHLDAVALNAHDLDLVLHLVASHHGYCRPFAPAVLDENPVEVALQQHKSETFGVIDFAPVSSSNELHRLDSPLADRFWRLVEKYGWLELCWLEAVLRLADHRASEEEQEIEDEA